MLLTRNIASTLILNSFAEAIWLMYKRNLEDGFKFLGHNYV